MKRKIGVWLICIALVSMFVLPGCNKPVAAEENSIQKEIDLSGVSVGDIVTLGSYEQDGDVNNGAEPIEWEVLSVEGNRALLISKYVLDRKMYNASKYVEVTWESCDLRQWMNQEFLNTAFTASEQAQIPTVTLSNPDNPYYGTEGGNDTEDKVFALSLDEIRKYYTFNSWFEKGPNGGQYGDCQKLTVEATPYARSQGAISDGMMKDDYDRVFAAEGYSADALEQDGVRWWLRTPKDSSNTACCVTCFGGAGASYASMVYAEVVGVRPALWVEY